MRIKCDECGEYGIELIGDEELSCEVCEDRKIDEIDKIDKMTTDESVNSNLFIKKGVKKYGKN